MVNTNTVENSNQVNTGYETKQTASKSYDYGKTIGQPKLSEEGQKYYEELKKKFGNMDFILVSKDMKEQAKSQAASFANPTKTVVLIDEEKIEKMATDASFRKQYEDIISNASSQLNSLKNSMMRSGANVKGYGIQVNDQGLTSMFAVLKKSTAAQKERIKEHSEQKKLDEKKAKKQEAQKEQKERVTKYSEDEETITLSAGSAEELLLKIEDYVFGDKVNQVRTSEEMMLGQNIDFRG